MKVVLACSIALIPLGVAIAAAAPELPTWTRVLLGTVAGGMQIVLVSVLVHEGREVRS